MSGGVLLHVAKRSASSVFPAALVAAVISAGVLGLSYRFFYNWWIGPVPFTATLSEDPGLHRWVWAIGPVVSTDLHVVPSRAGSRRSRLVEGRIQSGYVRGHYSTMLVGGKRLIVLSRRQLDGRVAVEGAMAPLRDDLRRRIGGADLHPWMLDTRDHYHIWRANLSVWIFLPCLGLAILVALAEIPGLLEPMRIVTARTKRYGDPAAVIRRIEAELRSAGVDGRTGQLWLTPSWLVGGSGFNVVRLADQVGIGVAADRTAVVCWERGRGDAVEFRASEPEARAVLEELQRSRPHLVVIDVEAYEEQWKADRLTCEAGADAAVAAAKVAAECPRVPSATLGPRAS